MDFSERGKTKTKPCKLNANKIANKLKISRRGPGRESLKILNQILGLSLLLTFLEMD